MTEETQRSNSGKAGAGEKETAGGGNWQLGKEAVRWGENR